MRVDLLPDLALDLRGGARVELARGEGAPHRGEPAVARADEGLPIVELGRGITQCAQAEGGYLVRGRVGTGLGLEG